MAADIDTTGALRYLFRRRREVWQHEVNWTTRRHHGSLAFLRRWGILVGACKEDAGPLRVAPLTDALRNVLRRALRPEVSTWVASLHSVGTLQEWVAQVDTAKTSLLALALPGMNSRDPDAYHIIWTIRCFVIAINAATKAEAGLYVAPTDGVSLLKRGFPDMGAQLDMATEATGTTCALQLMHMLHYTSAVEYFCMDLCLAKPAYKWIIKEMLNLCTHIPCNSW